MPRFGTARRGPRASCARPGDRGGPDADFERRLQTLYRLAVRDQEAWLPLMRADRWTEDDGSTGEDLRADDEALGLTPH